MVFLCQKMKSYRKTLSRKIGEKRYVRISEGARRYSVSPNTFRMMAAEAHAIIHVRNFIVLQTETRELRSR